MEYIFVRIASYRDPECQWTLADLFEKASFPDRVFAGVCWQYDQLEDMACFEYAARPDQVRTLMFHWKESRGVCWARYQAGRLWRGEEYLLSIDSHMRFEYGWDERLIAELAACPAEKPVLSNHPGWYAPPGVGVRQTLPTVLRANPFGIEGEIRMTGVTLAAQPERPLPGAFVAPGYLFSRATLINDVLYDPYLYFNQEELSLAVRLYTHGYDVFSPTQNWAYHYYGDINIADAPKRQFHWNDNPDWILFHELAAKRLEHLVGYKRSQDPLVTRELDTFGLGTARSLQAFGEFSGIEFADHSVGARALHCGFIPSLGRYLSQPISVPGIDDVPPESVAVATYPGEVFRENGVPAGAAQIPAPGAWIDPHAPPGVLVMHEYLSRELCETIKHYADTQTFTDLHVDDFGVSRLDPSRITNHVEIDGVAFQVLSIFNDVFCNRVAPFFNVEFEWYERPQILRYPPGGKYNEHSDADNWKADESAWRRCLDRDYSVIVYLNDDFEGGDLRMVRQEYLLRPKPGTIVAFPSDHHFTHAVLPTTQGIRYAIVSWAAIFGSPRVRDAAPYASLFVRQKRLP